MKLAPIVLFVYNRLKNTKETIAALQRNGLSNKSVLYIYSDGAKNDKDLVSVNRVREYLKTVNGFKETIIICRENNFGLKKNIISGVTEVINKFGNIIVLEDDLLTSSNFLNFMNQGLNFYDKNEKIHSISGYTMPLKILNEIEKDFYYGLRASSWGWATWDYIWNNIDWKVKDYKEFNKNSKRKKSFNKGGSDMSAMLRNNMSNKINSWAIIFCFDQWKKKRVTVFPVKSKILNLGFSIEASNTKYLIPEYKTILDDSKKDIFEFKNQIKINKKITKAFAYNFSYYVRIKNKILNSLLR